jgi:hypothetical protein
MPTTVAFNTDDFMIASSFELPPGLAGVQTIFGPKGMHDKGGEVKLS